MVDYSAKKVSGMLIEQIEDALQKVHGGYGSIEIIIQNHCVTQISTREITKTNQPIETAELSKRI